MKIHSWSPLANTVRSSGKALESISTIKKTLGDPVKD